MQPRRLDVGGHAQPAAIGKLNLGQRGTDRRTHTPADGRGADAGGDNRSGPPSSATRTGTKARSAGNGPNTPRRARCCHF